MRDAISQKSSTYSIVFDSEAKKDDLTKVYKEMEYVVENVVYGITAIMVIFRTNKYLNIHFPADRIKYCHIQLLLYIIIPNNRRKSSFRYTIYKIAFKSYQKIVYGIMK